MSYPSLAPFVLKRPWLKRWLQPLSKWYMDNSGYRKLGLRYESLSKPLTADGGSGRYLQVVDELVLTICRLQSR